MFPRLPARLTPVRSAAGAAALAAILVLPGMARALDEVPFITSPDHVTLEMLRIAGVGPRDHVIDLGSGDGRIVITAARRFGASGLGVEIVPELVARSRQAAAVAGVSDRVKFEEQDLFKTDLSRATVVTMYLLPEFNLRLRPALLALKPGTRIVSHDWDMGDWKPDKTTVLPVPDKPVGLDKTSRVHLWTVPGRVEGLWCGAGPLSSYALRLKQQYQEVRGTLTRRERTWQVEGRLTGQRLLTGPTHIGRLELEREGDRLRMVGGDGMAVLAKGTSFVPGRDGVCPGQR
jgi:SAM-dependent methyltransferase